MGCKYERETLEKKAFFAADGKSELVLLEELEEVLRFQAAVLGHVRAMQRVPNSVLAELRSRK